VERPVFKAIDRVTHSMANRSPKLPNGGGGSRSWKVPFPRWAGGTKERICVGHAEGTVSQVRGGAACRMPTYLAGRWLLPRRLSAVLVETFLDPATHIIETIGVVLPPTPAPHDLLALAM
jgi:hypothetical protein